MGGLIFIIAMIVIISKASKKNKEQQEQEAKKSQATSAQQAKPRTTPAATPKPVDPVCEEYTAARDVLLSLYRTGQINEEEMMQGNQELYDQYLAVPMEICRALRSAGVYDQGKVETDGEYAIFFKSEEAAWNACNALQRSRLFTAVTEEKRATTEWAFVPYETDKYRAEILIDRRIGLQKLVVKDKNAAEAPRRKITAEELEALRINAFDFTK